MMHVVSVALFIGAAAAGADDHGWVPLFNGKDLSNWVNVNCAPETWTVANGVLKCTGKPTGALRTPRMYENFILELQWRHLKPAGNSGVFVWGSAIAAPGVPFLRAIEVQVLDNAFNIPGKNEWYTTHGDVFPIHGATMKPIHKGHGMRCFPIEERSKSSPEWNQYRIVGRNGTLRLSVNGKEVSGGDDCVWRKGYLALESEGSPIEFRDIRVKELPSGGSTAEQSAPQDEGWQSLYNGIDLRGWKLDGDLKRQWSAHDWRLSSSAGASGILYTEKSWADFELIVDVHPAKGTKGVASTVDFALPTAPAGFQTVALTASAGEWRRNFLTVRGRQVTIKTNDGRTRTERLSNDVPTPRAIGLVGSSAGAIEFGNIYVRELK